MRIQDTLYTFLFLLISCHVIATEDSKNEIELTEILIHSNEQITDTSEIFENNTHQNVPELQIKIINDEDLFQCTICLQPFDIDNGKFKIEIIEKEFIKDHKIHESEFHKKCIQKWMKDNNSCPICRKILKQPFSKRLQKMIKSILSNPGFWMVVINLIILPKHFTDIRYQQGKIWCLLNICLSILMFFVWRQRMQNINN